MAVDAIGAGARMALPALPRTEAVRGPVPAGAVDGAQGTQRGGFGAALTDALDAVDADVKAGDRLANQVVRGEAVETHDLMIALEKADLSVRLMTQVGRRAVDAYREIMRLNV
jgi:flagellar hook-basal body complex protein FliE